MKMIIIYRPDSEHSRSVEDFINEFERSYNGGLELEVKNIDTSEGGSLARLYDIVSYPGYLVVDNQGSPIRIWQGGERPILSEVVGIGRL